MNKVIATQPMKIVSIKLLAPEHDARTVESAVRNAIALAPQVQWIGADSITQVNGSVRTRADTLTIAYVAIGAKEALLNDGARAAAEQRYNADDWNGELGFIETVTNAALMLDREADLVCAGDGFSGVFCYEVAEEFGEQFADALLDDRNADPRPIAERLIAEARA